MSVPYSHSYCQYSSPPLCCVNQTCKNYMTNSFTRKFPLFICHLSRFVQKKRFQATGLRALCIWNQMKGEAGKSEKNKKNKKTTIQQNAEPYSHTGPKITILIIQLQARVHSQFTALRTQHRVFQCVFTNTEPSDERECRSTQGWESPHWMHEWLITFLPVEPRLSTKKSLSLSLKRPN